MTKMREIKKIILHKSDSDIPSHDDIKVIDKWHKARGFHGVGYHFFITSTGTVEFGRTLESVGAHCVGHNFDSIGICLHGRSKFTDAQITSLRSLVSALQKQFENKLNVFGHCDFDKNKPHCPGFDYKQILGL